MGNISKKFTKSQDRIDNNGEVFTPKHIVVKILKLFPQKYFIDPTKTFLDPSCGNGNFLVAVVQIKLKCGSTPKQTLSTTFGVDIQQDNINECRERILTTIEKICNTKRTDEWICLVTKNVVCHDSLTYDFEFKES